jgi:hypothetical protein
MQSLTHRLSNRSVFPATPFRARHQQVLQPATTIRHEKICPQVYAEI